MLQVACSINSWRRRLPVQSATRPEMPALCASGVDDDVGFLNTLTDGYKP